MEPDIFSFQWHRNLGGYALEGSLASRGERRIVSKGGVMEPYHPRSIGRLHRIFAGIGDSEAEVLSFVQTYGFLGLDPHYAPAIKSEYVSEILLARDKLKKAIEVFEAYEKLNSKSVRVQKSLVLEGAIENSDIKKIGFRIQFAELFNEWASPQLTARIAKSLSDNGEALQLVFVPRSLIGSFWLQLAEEVTGGAKYKTCVNCGKSFEPGRSDQKTCSKACKSALSRKNIAARQTSDAKRLVAKGSSK